jgi:hypothetical protein
MKYNIVFQDNEGWFANIAITADTTLEAIKLATEKIYKTEDGAKLNEIVNVEVEKEE